MYNHNKAQQSKKNVCIFLGIYCMVCYQSIDLISQVVNRHWPQGRVINYTQLFYVDVIIIHALDTGLANVWWQNWFQKYSLQS